MEFYSTERTLVFIDGPDLHGIARSTGIEIDFSESPAHAAGSGHGPLDLQSDDGV